MLGDMTSPDSPIPAETDVRHVLVPLDGSEFSLAAMPTGRALAERFGAELHTISVVEEGDEADRLAALGSAVLGASTGDERARVVRGGGVTDGILARAEELGGCVVCLSTHGRGRLSGAVIGSVARELVQRSPQPVVALGPVGDLPNWTRTPRWPPPLSESRMVACVDGSPTSESVLPVAAGWARALGMSLTILTVTEDAPPPMRPERRTSPYGESADAADYVDDLARRWKATVPDVDGRVLRDPIGPAGALRAHLDEEPAGLVALTSHARAGLQRVLLGAAAASIVHISPAPCLVVPSA